MAEIRNTDALSRRDYLLGVTVRYPSIRGILHVDELPPEVRERLRTVISNQMLEDIARFSDAEVEAASQRIFERFAPVPQFGI